MIRWWVLATTGLLLWACGCSQAPNQFVPDLSGPAVPWTDHSFGEGGGDFHFAIVSDRFGSNRPGVFEAAVDKLNLLQPEFVISIGDLISGVADTPGELASQQEEFDRIVSGLEMRFFYVPGNHDINNELSASGWQARYGRPYYHFLYKGALFVVLCTERHGATNEEQIEYLRRLLEANRTVRWTFLFMHKPTFVQEPNTPKHPLWAKIDPLLVGRKHTIFAGDWHEYAICERNGSKYIRLATTGGGSDLLGKDFGSFDHVVWVTVRDDGPRIANLMLDGIDDAYVSTPERTRRSYELLEGVKLAASVAPATPGPVQPAQTKLAFTNKTDLPATVTAVFQPDHKLLPSPPSMALRLPPKSDKTVDLLLKPATEVSLADIKPLTLVYSVSYQMPDGTSRKFDFSRRIGLAEVLPLRHVERPIIIDGQLDDWADLPIVVERPGQIGGDVEGHVGPDDCRFRFGAAYDEEYLYIGVEVSDDNVILDANRRPHDQDAVLILLGSDPGAGPEGRAFSIRMCPGKEPTKPNVDTRGTKPKGTKRGSARTAKGYTAELAVPFLGLKEAWGRPCREIRVNVVVMDRDVPDKTTELYWQVDWWSPQAVYGSGTFSQEPPARSPGPASTQADAPVAETPR